MLQILVLLIIDFMYLKVQDLYDFFFAKYYNHLTYENNNIDKESETKIEK